MQISDEMVEAADKAFMKAIFATSYPVSKECMRAALEAALIELKAFEEFDIKDDYVPSSAYFRMIHKMRKKYSAADNLRNWAKAKATEDNDYLRADLLSNAACIEDLAAALNRIEKWEDGPIDQGANGSRDYFRELARAVLERWGMK